MEKKNDPYKIISDKLDRITIVLLAQSGLTQKEIAKIFDVSEKTIERIFAGNFNKIRRSNVDV